VKAQGLDLSSLVIVLMDEYLIDDGGGHLRPPPVDAHFSVAGFAVREIVGPLNAAASPGRGISSDRVWQPSVDDLDAFDDRLAGAGGIDLFILASGDSDGHVAFNPPGTDANSWTRVVPLPTSTRKDNLGTFPEFKSLDEVPGYGLTVGIATIVTLSRRAVLVAPGRSKQTAVARIAASRGYDPSWPATAVCACEHPSLYTDEEGAGPAADNSVRADDRMALTSTLEPES
jgi:glucosamine-6-phosphate deaminase